MAQVQAVQKHWRATLERVEKFISDTYFTDVNLRRISFQVAQQALSSTAELATKDVSLGQT